MTTDDSDALWRVAGAISDGEKVDWGREVAESDDLAEFEGELRALEILAATQSAEVGERPESSQRTWGGLRIVRPLGQGSFGQVFRAYDPTLEREVALKLLRPERSTGGAGARFVAEARRLARVRHPHVVMVHGADIHDGQIGLWMELLEGRTLEEMLALLGRFGPYEAVIAGMQLCRALAAVHAVELVHLDVKPSNVFRENGGRIVLMDFGTVRELDPGTGALADRQGSPGTPLVMAPEQLAGGPVGPTADLYGLGVLLYRLVAGRYPIEARTVSELAEKHASQGVTPLRDARPDLPVEFLRVVERALNPRPEQRFASAGAMERALAMAGGTLTRTELGIPAASRRTLSTRVLIVLAALVIVGLLLWRLSR